MGRIFICFNDVPLFSIQQKGMMIKHNRKVYEVEAAFEYINNVQLV